MVWCSESVPGESLHPEHSGIRSVHRASGSSVSAPHSAAHRETLLVVFTIMWY